MPTRTFWISVLWLFLVACNGENGPNSTPPKVIETQLPPYEIKGSTVDESITSVITNISYPLHVYLPPTYADSNTAFAVLYATDGQWIFEGFAKAIDKKGLNIILVAIEQGPNDRRATDYLLPGARDYYQFLISELIPEIESRYNIDAERRTLSGTSYGGLFVGLALLLEDDQAPYFRNYLSFDGSFYATPSLLNQLLTERRETSPQMQATLMLTSATIYGNDSSVSQFQSMLEAQEFTQLHILRQAYNVTHEQIADPSFTDALDILDW